MVAMKLHIYILGYTKILFLNFFNFLKKKAETSLFFYSNYLKTLGNCDIFPGYKLRHILDICKIFIPLLKKILLITEI